MSTETAKGAPEAGPSGQFPQALLETLRSNGADASALLSLFARTSLTAEQQAFIEVLMSLDDADSDDDPTPSPAKRADEYPRVMQEELNDLREVNDTLARALGACAYCWGGDSDCPNCGGMGSAGNELPNLELYHELVAPAVRRVRAMERRGALSVAKPSTGSGEG